MLINEQLIIIDLEVTDKLDAITKLAEIAYQNGKLNNKEEYIKSVLEREASFSTGVGNGIAIPHGKSSGVKEAMIVFARTKNKLEWQSLDDLPVNMIFLLGVPAENVDNVHLKILSLLSRKLMDEEFVEKINSSTDKVEIFELLRDIEEKIN